MVERRYDLELHNGMKVASKVAEVAKAQNSELRADRRGAFGAAWSSGAPMETCAKTEIQALKGRKG